MLKVICIVKVSQKDKKCFQKQKMYLKFTCVDACVSNCVNIYFFIRLIIIKYYSNSARI